MEFWRWIEPTLFLIVSRGTVVVPLTTVLFAFISSAIHDAKGDE